MPNLVVKTTCTLCILGAVMVLLRFLVFEMTKPPHIVVHPFTHETMPSDEQTLYVRAERSPIRSTKPKAFLHIGMPKTGSSYIQNKLEAFRFKIQNNGDYTLLRYNYTKAWVACIHHSAYRRHDAGRPRACDGTDVKNALSIALAANHTVIASLEDISLFENDDQVQQLADMFSDFDVHLAIYLRRGLPWSLSAWQFNMARVWTKVHHPVSFAVSHGSKSYAIKLDLFAKAFSVEQLNVFSFDGVLQSGNDLFGVFLCELVGFPCDTLSEWSTQPANVHFPLDMVHLRSAIYSVVQKQHCRWLWNDIDHDAILKLKPLWLELNATKNYQRTVECIPLNHLQPSFDQVHRRMFVDYRRRLWYFPSNLSFPDVSVPDLCVSNHERFPSAVLDRLNEFVAQSSYITNASACAK